MFTVEAFYAIESSKLSHITASEKFDSVEARDAAVKAFPKWVNVKASSITVYENGIRTEYPTAVLRVLMTPTKGNEVNETGVKRVKKFLDLAGEVNYRVYAKNSVPSLAEVMALLA